MLEAAAFYLRYEYLPGGLPFRSKVSLNTVKDRLILGSGGGKKSDCAAPSDLRRLLSDTVAACFGHGAMHLMYSGGIDSSVLCAAAQDAGVDIATYSIGFRESFCDESSYRICRRTDKSGSHKEILLTPGMFASEVRRAVDNDAAGCCLYAPDVPAFSAAIKEFVMDTATLAFGLAADEWFFGYPYMIQGL
ncbi:MAG: asparagine synthase-related protein, partial [Candidatus Wallbacteria bacterium]|nr:asparagine synthase-related protein [Candidatus Wallbacteria bacterium]